MAGHGGVRAARAALALLLLLGPALAGGCAPRAAADPERARVQRLLDRRAHDLIGRDESGFLTTGGRGADTAAEHRSATWFDNLADVPLASLTYRVTGFHRSGHTATADAELGYRLTGFDAAPLTSRRTVRLRESRGRWYVTADTPAKKASRQLWEQGRVRVVRGTHSLVLGVGQDTARLRHFAALADRAVPAVTDAWGGAWARRIVVEVPGSLNAMGDLLGSPASGYRGIAAVTTGEAGGIPRAPADRIVVNPEAYGVLGDFGQQVVLTHETTHVATRSATTAATPLWLSEGYADWSGYRGSGRTAPEIAPELRRAVLAGHQPAGLPTDADFGFARAADPLAEAYEGGWLACRMIAERWGEDRLRAFYARVGTHDAREGAVESALHDVLDTGLDDFTAQWRAYVRKALTAATP
ncbi:hypothetical protein [Streptomyces sp. NPDC050560]|uniref:hypothetical protein n=1 Tax=Streptomyces sp. NPDC050560 TaxID=3365630 RepID=UPI0037A06BFD